MNVIAIYNMKGGVGKTTTAVNVSYQAAAAGQRTLLWDLDPQAAASFAFRVRPRVEGFGKRNLAHGETLAGAIKETDYQHLDLLPADFAYRKMDRLLGHFGKPQRVVSSLIETLGRNYDTVVLDCPAGFSLLIEGVLPAADVVLVPTIPTVLSLRMVSRLVKWADRAGASADIAAFFSMVDRRKLLHRRACEWAVTLPDVFMAEQIPYSSIVEQITVRRMPLAAFAPRDPAAAAFAAIWAEVERRRTRPAVERSTGAQGRWPRVLQSIEAMVARLEAADGQEAGAPRRTAAYDATWTTRAGEDVHFIHSFDTDRRDLQQAGYLLELREREGRWLIVAGPAGEREAVGRTEAQIDGAWASQILSAEMSPLEALERRLGRPMARPLERLRATIAGRRLVRTASRASTLAPAQAALRRLARQAGTPPGPLGSVTAESA